MYNDIISRRCDIIGIRHYFEDVITLSQWNTIINVIKDETRQGILPVIHLEIHGKKNEGLNLKSNEVVTWESFYRDLQEINLLTHNNLMLTKGVCSGMDITKYIQIGSVAPYFCAIGSFYMIFSDDILIRYTDFYDEFLQFFDISKALKRLFYANPNEENMFSFINAEALFCNVYKKYLTKDFGKEAVKRRWNDSLADYERMLGRMANRQERLAKMKQFGKELEKIKDKYFRDGINIFLMTKDSENAGRFEIPSMTKEFIKKDWSKIIPNIVV